MTYRALQAASHQDRRCEDPVTHDESATLEKTVPMKGNMGGGGGGGGGEMGGGGGGGREGGGG